MLDVLPRALVSAAAEVRGVARDAEPVRPDDVGDRALTAALEEFTSAWGAAVQGLAAAAGECADDLGAAASDYVMVESLLVPVALR